MTQVQQLLDRYTDLMHEIADALSEEFKQRGCPNLKAQFIPHEEGMQVFHTSQPSSYFRVHGAESLQKLTQVKRLPGDLNEVDRIAWIWTNIEPCR